MSSTIRVLTGLLLTTAVAAQEPGRYLPPGAAVYVHCDAPASLARAFEVTDLAAMLASREVEDLIESTGAAFRDLMGSEDSPPQLERLGEIFDRFEGRLRLAVVLDPPAEDATGPGEPNAFVAMELTGSDVEALEEMAELFAEISEYKGDETIDVTIAGETFLGMTSGGGELLLLPRQMGESLVVYMGHDVEERVGAILGREEGTVPDGLEESPLALRVDVEGLLEFLAPLVDRELPVGAETFFSALRLDGLRDMVLTAAPDGPHTRIDFSLGMDPQQPGLVEFLRPAQGGRPSLLELVPRQHRYWSVGFLRFDALYEWVSELLVEFEAPMDMAGVEAMFEQQFKVRLREDLLAHCGDEVLSLQSMEPVDPDAEDVNAVLGHMTLAFELDDAAAFEQSFERLLRSRGLHVARKTREYRGVQVRNLTLFAMLELHYAFGDDVVVFGFGKEPDGLNQLLDRIAARREGEEPGSFPDRVAQRLESMPEGWQGLGVTDLRGLLDAFAGGFAAAMHGAPPDAAPMLGELDRWVETFGRLVERYELELIVSTSKFTKDRMLMRAVW